LRCPICGREFKNVIGLKVHARTTHFGAKCPICDREFAKPHSLVLHLKNKKDSDPKHLVLFYLLRRGNAGYFEGRERAIELLRRGLRI